jgi:hypothetical protein
VTIVLGVAWQSCFWYLIVSIGQALSKGDTDPVSGLIFRGSIEMCSIILDKNAMPLGSAFSTAKMTSETMEDLTLRNGGR